MNSQMEVKSPFGFLDSDCLIHVLSFVPQYDLFALTVLSTAIRDLIHSTASLWRHFILTNLKFIECQSEFGWLMNHVRSIKFAIDIVESYGSESDKSLAQFLKKLKQLTSVEIDNDLVFL